MNCKLTILLLAAFLALAIALNPSENDGVISSGATNNDGSSGNGATNNDGSSGNGATNNDGSSGSGATNNDGSGGSGATNNDGSSGSGATNNKGSNPDTSSYIADVKTATENLLGLNCIVEAVFSVEDSAGDFQYDVKLCGGRPPVDVSFIIDDTDDVTAITSKIIDDNDELCNNAAYKEDEDANVRTTAACAASIVRQMTKLQGAIKTVTDDIDNLNAKTACITIAASTFQLSLGTFAQKVATCSKLAKSF